MSASVHVGHPDNVVHVYPARQEAEHDTAHGPLCWCQPETRIVDEADGLSAAGVMIIHREIRET